MGPTTEVTTALPLEWRGDRLAVTDPAALARLDRTALSASTMKAMRGCPARYVADKLLPRVEDPFSPAAIGTSAHTVFERLFTEKPVRRTTERALEILIDLGEETWSRSQEVARLRWSAAVMDKVLPLFTIEDPTAVNVLSTEEPFDGVQVGGVPFVGYIDRVEQGEDDSIKVVDYKTGRASSAADIKRWGDPDGDQLRLYVAAYQARHGVKPKAAVLHYTGAGRCRKVSVTGPAVARSTAAFQRAWTELKGYIQTGEFATRPSALCGWCPLVNSCPVAHADGKVAKIPAPSADQLAIPVAQTHRPRRVWDMSADLESALEQTHAEPIYSDHAGGADVDVLGDLTDQPWHEDESSAHHEDASTTPNEEESIMIDGFSPTEAKPWEDLPGDELDPNSYRSIALFGLVSLAVEKLGASGIKVTPSTVNGLAATFATVVLDAQQEMTGTRDWQAGANTRLRGALHAVLSTVPLPFGGDEEAWDAWVVVASRRCVSIAKTVITLHTGSYGQRPWADLATRAVPDAA